MNYYYGTTTALAWILGHYFYGAGHRAWVSREYYPYRLPNPKSSNPHLIYQDLYQPWRDRDDFDKYITQARLNARKSVIAQELASVIDPQHAPELKEICDRIDILFLYPFILRVDIDRIRATDPARLILAGSALAGSCEFLIERLRESPSEFSILFLDFRDDPDFKRLVFDEYHSPMPDAQCAQRARCERGAANLAGEVLIGLQRSIPVPANGSTRSAFAK
ncbi:MAG: hypothetical protein M3Z36_14600 [Acidobacteriota bacterium]|nr:hypothetical protein [Acidobacteriota bacterium]